MRQDWAGPFEVQFLLVHVAFLVDADYSTMRVGRGTSSAVAGRTESSSLHNDQTVEKKKARKDLRGSSSSRSKSPSKHSQNGRRQDCRTKNTTGSGSHRSGERSRGSSSKRRMPVIDRIPTAISYRSADSEDERKETEPEQQSKTSRYSNRYDPPLSGTDDEADDRYSLAKRTKSTASSSKTSPLSNQKNASHIERLWSDDSFETNRQLSALESPRQLSAPESPMLTPRQIVTKQSSGSKDKYSKDGLVDPIYDSPKKKKEQKTTTSGKGFSFDNCSHKNKEKKNTKDNVSKQEKEATSPTHKAKSRSGVKSRSAPRQSSKSRTHRRSASKSPHSTRSKSSRSTGTRSKSRSKDATKAKKRSSSIPKSRGSSTSRHRSSSSRDRGRSESSKKRTHRRRSTSRSGSKHSNKSSRDRHGHRRSTSAHSLSSRASKSKSPGRDRYHQRSESKTRQHKTSSSQHSKSKKSHSSKSSSRKEQVPPPVVVEPKWTPPPLASPTADSETSSLTDPLHNMLSHSTTEKVVKEIEHKLKLLKKAAAEEKAAMKRAKRESKKKKGSCFSGSKTEVNVLTSVCTQPSSDSGIQKKVAGTKIPVLPSEQEELPTQPKDAVEMTRSTSDSTELLGVAFLPKERKQTKKMANITARNLNEVEVQKEQSADETSQEQQDALLKLESQPTYRSVNSSGRPFSKLFSKTKISVGPAGLGAGAENDSEKMIHNGQNVRPPSGRRKDEPLGPMYTNALFTAEDSTAFFAQASPLYTTLNDERPKTGFPGTPMSDKGVIQHYVISQSTPTDDAVHASPAEGNKKLNPWGLTLRKKEKKKVEGKSITKVAPPWKFGRKKPDTIPRSSSMKSLTIPRNASMKSLKLAKSSSFWKKQAREPDRKMEKTNSVVKKRRLKTKQNVMAVANGVNAEYDNTYRQTAPLWLDPATMATKSRNNNVAELDEYSVHEGVSDDPALIQCLKFYSCGTLADKVNAAIQATSCPGAFMDREEDTGDTADGEHLLPGTPEPAVEVVLDNLLHQYEQSLGAKGSHKSVSSRHSLLSCGDTSSWDEAIRAPPSYLIEVTDKQLRLDGDIFPTWQQQPVRSVYGDGLSMAMSRADFSVTSVRIPQINKQKKNLAKKREKKQNKIRREQSVHEGLDKPDKPESIDQEEEEESQAGYNSSHDNEMGEVHVYQPEDEQKGGGNTGRLQKLVSRFRKK